MSFTLAIFLLKMEKATICKADSQHHSQEHKSILVGTASMTGDTNGCIAWPEHMLHQPLQWTVDLLHCHELPLCHEFVTLDGSTTSPCSVLMISLSINSLSSTLHL